MSLALTADPVPISEIERESDPPTIDTGLNDQADQTPKISRRGNVFAFPRQEKIARHDRTLRTVTWPKGNNGAVGPGTFETAHQLRIGAFTALSEWEGVVLDASLGAFVARLTDPKHLRPDEEAEFSLEEIPEFDHPLVQPGAVFYWTIGYWDSVSGLRSRISQLRFRRLPVWDAVELARAKANAEQLSKLFE